MHQPLHSPRQPLLFPGSVRGGEDDISVGHTSTEEGGGTHVDDRGVHEVHGGEGHPRGAMHVRLAHGTTVGHLCRSGGLYGA